MLTLTLPDRQTLTADTDVMLANLLAVHRYGNDWDADLCPFDEHTIMGELLEELALIQDGTLDGHTLTDTHSPMSIGLDTCPASAVDLSCG